ncbi:MAG: tyrosyl-tRNA synthetase [Paraglaciecola sp.]|jgi:tyrosyl-tRNA synthetase
MNFIEELKWRGMYYQSTDEAGVEQHLLKEKRVGYIGFDPTAPALTIGNFVQIMILKLFQLSGHKPIVLMGGATGRIGDPSGKSEERELKSFDLLKANLAAQQENFYKFLDFDGGDNVAEFRNNYDFYKNMNAMDFLRLGKKITINYMTSKTSVKKRIETGLSFTEFSYQILQGYDFQHLYENDGVTLQMGGSDQWGNITTGTEFIGKNTDGKAYAVTTPLLTKADGSKFGKSEKGNIWLDAKLTSPYKFYQFWINAADADIKKFNRYFTLKSRAETEALEADFDNNPNILKQSLGKELTIRVHGQAAYEAVLKVSELLFNKKANKETLLSLAAKDLAVVGGEIPSFTIAKSVLENGVAVIDLIAEQTSIVASKGEGRRAIKGGAVSVNKDKISNHETVINHENLLHGRYLMVDNGKKNKFMIVVE